MILGVVLSIASARAAEPPAKPAGSPRLTETSCFQCHAQLSDEALEPTKHATDDIHFLKGLACHDCHGGDPTAIDDMDASHNPKKGWTGKPERLHIPEFCAKCHSDAAYMKKFDPKARVDQLSEYRTSVHGQKNAKGDPEVAVCIDCHKVHGIRAISDPRSPVYPTNVAETCARCHADEKKMAGYGVPTNQYSQYKTSVHAAAIKGGDLSAPTCNDCHGSHGAAPPGLEDVTSVCGSCHPREATLFRETEAKKKMDLSPCIRCIVCHSNHAVLPPSDEMLGVGKDSTCTGCHTEGDPGYKAAAQMAQSIQDLKGKVLDATHLLDRAERAGMEVSEDRFALQKGKDGLVQSRVLAHGFDLERFLVAANGGIAAADAGVAAGKRLFAELRFRRLGLGLSLLVISAVIVALSLKIRQLGPHDPK
jgi:hypothetical protein